MEPPRKKARTECTASACPCPPATGYFCTAATHCVSLVGVDVMAEVKLGSASDATTAVKMCRHCSTNCCQINVVLRDLMLGVSRKLIGSKPGNEDINVMAKLQPSDGRH